MVYCVRSSAAVDDGAEALAIFFRRVHVVARRRGRGPCASTSECRFGRSGWAAQQHTFRCGTWRGSSSRMVWERPLFVFCSRTQHVWVESMRLFFAGRKMVIGCSCIWADARGSSSSCVRCTDRARAMAPVGVRHRSISFCAARIFFAQWSTHRFFRSRTQWSSMGPAPACFTCGVGRSLSPTGIWSRRAPAQGSFGCALRREGGRVHVAIQLRYWATFQWRVFARFSYRSHT